MEHNKWDKSPNAKAKYKLKILEKRDMQQGANYPHTQRCLNNYTFINNRFISCIARVWRFSTIIRRLQYNLYHIKPHPQ
jgi:hypothetical protein